MASFLNEKGEVQQVELSVDLYRRAHTAGMSLPAFLAREYRTDASRYGHVFNQILASEGIYVKADREVGIRPSTLAQVLRPELAAGGVTVKDGIPASRILFPAVIMQVVEDKLVANLTMTANAFDEMVGYDETINGDRYEQPVINFKGAEAGRSRGIAQLAEPALMMTITSSDKAYRIPTFSLGLEVSDQALAASTLDFVALALARQAAVERNERAQTYVLALYNGDVDNNDGTLASKGLVDTSTSFDSNATGGVLTHKAWMKYLMKNGTKRVLTHLVTDFDTAYKIETRTGKPTVTGDDSNTSRIDTQFQLMNPTWAKNPKIFLSQDSAWPANTIMGIDKNWAIRRVRNLSADYQAIEAYVMRRSQVMRFDFGEHVNRMFDEAFGCMTIS